jgi:hypothetical protein
VGRSSGARQLSVAAVFSHRVRGADRVDDIAAANRVDEGESEGPLGRRRRHHGGPERAVAQNLGARHTHRAQFFEPDGHGSARACTHA